ncbi:MAG: hypothetical protein ABI868_15990 [Acidobacteriota bacterium]
MAENKPFKEDEFEINPDGADLDGTAEIERQQAGKTGPKGSPEPPVPATDTRGEAETVK